MRCINVIPTLKEQVAGCIISGKTGCPCRILFQIYAEHDFGTSKEILGFVQKRAVSGFISLALPA